jgi:hypothetical protein
LPIDNIDNILLYKSYLIDGILDTLQEIMYTEVICTKKYVYLKGLCKVNKVGLEGFHG